MPETFASFAEFIERFVIPCRAAHPEWRRLDGAQSGGNRSISAFVQHGDGVFRVHADCWFESLMAPYAASKQRPGEPSLAVVLTRGGSGTKLEPRPGFGSGRGFYVYRYR